jgi:hypothetical protein
MHAAVSFAPQPGIGSSRPAVTLAAGFILLTALFAGNLFNRLGLPRLTGYLVLGLVVGPYAMGLISEHAGGSSDIQRRGDRADRVDSGRGDGFQEHASAVARRGVDHGRGGGGTMAVSAGGDGVFDAPVGCRSRRGCR